MAIKKSETKDEYLPNIKPGSPEMEAFLAAGYPDIGTREHAKEIVALREKDHSAYPWEVYQRALAFLAALDTKPIAIDTDPGYRDDIQTN